MKILAVIPARGGSKGIPGKNIKLLNGKPLICYSIDVARQIVSDKDICVSSDDRKIIETVKSYGLDVPFTRPDELATDTATSNDVLLHALQYYKNQGKEYDAILLLQPTSPLRTAAQVKEALDLYSQDVDMVVSVKKSHAAVVLCREDDSGFLVSPLNPGVSLRQQVDEYYEYNGAIYIINVKSLLGKGLSGFTRRRKYVMPAENSIDIDTPWDWNLTEILLNKCTTSQS